MQSTAVSEIARQRPGGREPTSMTAPSLSVVLITWNSERFLERCLAGIADQTLSGIDLHLVDNASTDGSVETALSVIPDFHLIRNETNRGFSAAANQGIAASKGTYVLLLNPDVFLERDYAVNCVEALEEHGARFGSATGKLLRGIGSSIQPTHIVDSKGIVMTRNGRHLDIGAGVQDDGLAVEPFEVFGVSGAAAVYRRSFLDDAAVGGQAFDESFFAYREDADLAWRGRLLGWRALSVPRAVGYHVRTVTPEKRKSLPPSINMHSVKNRFLLRLKNQGRYLTLRNLPRQAFRDLVVLVAALTVERSSLPAFRWLWQHRGEIMKSRREIQQRRRVTDRQLAPWFRHGG